MRNALVALVLVGCRSQDISPPEPDNAPAATALAAKPLTTSVASALPEVVDATPTPSPWPITHSIVEKDHLHRVDLRIGDFLETPALDEFVWTPQPNDLLVAQKGDGGPRAQFKAVKPGSTRFVVRGEPKCRMGDASCGTSVREWTVFVVVQ